MAKTSPWKENTAEVISSHNMVFPFTKKKKNKVKNVVNQNLFSSPMWFYLSVNKIYNMKTNHANRTNTKAL